MDKHVEAQQDLEFLSITNINSCKLPLTTPIMGEMTKFKDERESILQYIELYRQASISVCRMREEATMWVQITKRL